jgi:hypothetical protein
MDLWAWVIEGVVMAVCGIRDRWRERKLDDAGKVDDAWSQ